MKTYVELSLVAILIVLLYKPPMSVTIFAKSVIGKVLLVLAIVGVSKQFGMNAGLLMSIVAIVLLNHSVEGLDNIDMNCKGDPKCLAKTKPTPD